MDCLKPSSTKALSRVASVLVSSQTHSPEDRESELTTAQKEVPETAPEVPAGPGDPVAAGCCRLLPTHGNGAARHGAVLWKVAGSALCSPKERAVHSSSETVGFVNMHTLSSQLHHFWRCWKQPLSIPRC